MDSTDNYDFSIFRPRNLHGKKNRNVIFSMLAIWIIAVFGFQFLLRVIEKPTPEKTLVVFESSWQNITEGSSDRSDYSSLIRPLVLVRGKTTVKPADQAVISDAISHLVLEITPDSLRAELLLITKEIASLTGKLAGAGDSDFLGIRSEIVSKYRMMAELTHPFTGFEPESLEASILVHSLKSDYPGSLTDSSLENLPAIMKLYLTHNQSVLTDTIFIGFPFHYFYTAFFLLVLFVCLCIVYNILIEWRLRKEGVIE